MKNNLSRFLSVLQKLGQSLMIPVSVLPAAGLVVALGRALQGTFEVGTLMHQVGQVAYSGGLAVFEQLPLVFAVGVAIGFTGGAGVAGLTAVVGYFTLMNLLKLMGTIRSLELAINTGVFGGIIIGLLAAWLYNRYYKTQLHPVLGFFSGKRLVPILMVFATLLLSLFMGFVWPPVQLEINHFGQWVMTSEFGPAFYAAGKRLLIPIGLHHVYYPPFLYQFGEFVTSTGKVVTGDSARYFAGDKSAGLIMASEFPIMLFGLPAAALAMVARARREKRKAIAGVMITAALTSIITGITEPIEFTFIFVAPILFVLHVILAFISGVMTQMLDIHLGYTFSASLIDFILGYFNQTNGWQLFTIVGPIIAILYFAGFYTLIGVMNLKTPGRDLNEVDPSSVEQASLAPVGDLALAREVLVALGGTGNIKNLEACITRLRTIVNDPKKVDQARLKSLGAAGIFHDGHQNFQVVFGTKSDLIKEQIQSLMTSQPLNEKTYHLTSPLKGKVYALAQVPDKTFAGEILGKGIAIEPTEGVIYAPFDGTAVQVFKTGHAVGLEGPKGLEVLIHIGIDTVKMNGVGFQPLIKSGDRFKQGDRLIEFDLEAVKKMAPSAMTPIVITNSDDMALIRPIVAGGAISVGQSLMEIEFKGAQS